MKGILTVVSGFSGSGKGTIMKMLLSHYDDYALSISATTRYAREGEENGRDYFFVSVSEFEQMIENDQLLEYANYVGNYYGTPRAYVEEMLEAGKNVLLEIECQGAFKIKKAFPDCVLIFITAPSVSDIRSRLKKRGTETDEQIEKRIRRAAEECEVIQNYDYLVVNRDQEECTRLVDSLIRGAQYRVDRQEEFIAEIKNQLLKQQKGE